LPCRRRAFEHQPEKAEPFVINRVTPVKGGAARGPWVERDGPQTWILQGVLPPLPGAGASSRPGRLDLKNPGVFPRAPFVPRLQPRAVAPPVGRHGRGSLLLAQSQFFSCVAGSSVSDDAAQTPARDALKWLAQLGGYGLPFYVD